MSPRLRRLLLVLTLTALVALLWWWWSAGTTARIGPPPSTPLAGVRARPGARYPDPSPTDEAPPADVKDSLTPEERDLVRPFLGATTVLDNGLTVIVVPRFDTHLVGARIVVRVGGADDDVPGVAHLLEHLMFRGTPSLGTVDWAREAPALDEVGRLLEALAAHPSRDLEDDLADAEREASRSVRAGETFELLEQLGATRVNGTTTSDATTYQLVLPVDALEPWAWFELDRFSGPALRGFRLERDIVGHERVRRGVHAGGGPWGQLRAALFAGHPYAQGVAGDEHTVGVSTPADAQHLFDRWYLPRNMAVVLVGPLEPDAVVELVAATLGTLPDHPVPRRDRPPLSPTRGEVAIDGRKELFGWALDPVSAADRAPLELAAALVSGRLEAATGLGGVESGVRPLVDGTEVTFSAWCWAAGGCRSHILDELARLASTPPSTCSVAHAAAGARFGALKELESVEAHAEAIADAWVRGEGLHDQQTALLALGGVTPQEVSEAARSLTTDALVWGRPTAGSRWVPSGARPSLPRTLRHQSGHSELFEQLAAPRSSPTAAPPWPVELREDGAVAVAPNPVNALYAARLHFPGGWEVDPWRCRALENLLLETSACSPGIPAGTRVGVDCTGTDTWLTVQGDSAGAASAVPALVRRFGDWNPDHFRTAAYLRGHEVADQRRSAVFDLQPLRAPPTGEPRPADLVRALAALGVPDRLEVVGNFSLDEVQTWVDLAPTAPTPARSAREVTVPTVVVDPEAGATELVRALAPWRREDEPIVAFLEAWWTGPGGVFFRTVREEAGLDYAPTARLDRGNVPGDPVMLTASGRGIETMLSVFEVELDAETFEQYRAAALQDAAQSVPFREAPGLARRFLQLGVPDGDPLPVRHAGLLELRREDVVRWLARARPPLVRTRSLDLVERQRLQARGVEIQGSAPPAVRP